MAIENIEEIRGKILEELSRYPPEKVGSLIDEIENANEEELEEFILNQQKMQQGQPINECIFCGIASGKIETIKIYEDKEVMAILDIMPASVGHILVFPKEHRHFIQELDDKILSKIFIFIKQISSQIIKTLKAEGISIYIPQGQIAGQRIPHFVVNVIPRYKDDKISFDWERVKKDKKDLEKIAEQIRNEIKRSKVELLAHGKSEDFPALSSEKEEKPKELPKIKRKIPR